jgi:DNA-binding beta-propeller fold protein YncE
MENIDLDSKDNLYVADIPNDRIQKFTKDGVFILEWGSRGDKNGEFEGPSGVSVDSSDNVYVIDDTGRIQKFTEDGTFITSLGSDGSSDGQFSKAEGLDVDPDGNVYVADTANKRIQVFSPSSTANYGR